MIIVAQTVFWLTFLMSCEEEWILTHIAPSQKKEIP